MNDLQKILQKMNTISQEIEEVMTLSGFSYYDALSGLDIDYKDSEQLLLWDELKDILDKLEEAKCRIDYLNKPIKETGRLHRNETGEYITESGHCYTMGDKIEFLVSNDNLDAPYWMITSVWHNGKDYCLDIVEEVPMEGLTVRVRESEDRMSSRLF